MVTINSIHYHSGCLTLLLSGSVIIKCTDKSSNQIISFDLFGIYVGATFKGSTVYVQAIFKTSIIYIGAKR